MRLTRGDETALVGEDDGLCPISQSGLGEDAGDVALHGRRADVESVGDLGVARGTCRGFGPTTRIPGEGRENDRRDDIDTLVRIDDRADQADREYRDHNDEAVAMVGGV